MNEGHSCPLCKGNNSQLKLVKNSGATYWDCSSCLLIYLDSKFYLSPSEEKARYETHNNDVNDVRYQNFVLPIVNYVESNFEVQKLGLDFGAGAGPILAHMLKNKGYDVSLYDPFFWNDPIQLTKCFDYIVSSEVIEHFHHPHEEFLKLRSILNDGGELILMTDLYADTKDFASWYYHKDPTHVVFYREETFEWIRQNLGFNKFSRVHDRVIVLSK